MGPCGFDRVTGGGATRENCYVCYVSQLTWSCPEKTIPTMKSLFYCKPWHTFLKEPLDLIQTLSSLESLYCRNWHMLLPLCSRLVPYGLNAITLLKFKNTPRTSADLALNWLDYMVLFRVLLSVYVFLVYGECDQVASLSASNLSLLDHVLLNTPLPSNLKGVVKHTDSP